VTTDIHADAGVAEVVEREIKRIGGEVSGLQQSVERDIAEARKLAEEGKTHADLELKRVGQSLEQKLGALHAELKAREAAEKAATDRLQAVEAVLNRTPRGGAAGAEDEAKAAALALELRTVGMAVRGELKVGNRPAEADVAEYRTYLKAFDTYTRKGQVFTDAEQKALTTGSDAQGGYLVPPTMSARIIKRVFETSPIRQIAAVETIGTDRLELPLDDDEASVAWFGEEQTRSETATPVIGLLTIDAKELGAMPKITARMLEDAAINVESWLADKVADKIARTENTAFVSGTGPMKPRGFLSYPSGTGRQQVEQVASKSVGTLVADDLVQIRFKLKQPYQGNATYVMRRSTVGLVAVMKDGTGQYLWSPGLRGAVGADTLASRPLVWADDMPDVATGALSVAYGDFRQAYTIVDRLGISMMRDPYTQKGWVVYYFRKRVGGGLTLGESLKLIVIS
jgi:HK97 family phage major capsid protein